MTDKPKPAVGKSLLQKATAPKPLPTDPVELAKVTRANADYHRDILKPFA